MEKEIDFEAFFDDEYWEQRKELALKELSIMKEVLVRAEHPTGLVDKLIASAGERPAYLTNVSPEVKEILLFTQLNHTHKDRMREAQHNPLRRPSAAAH